MGQNVRYHAVDTGVVICDLWFVISWLGSASRLPLDVCHLLTVFMSSRRGITVYQRNGCGTMADGSRFHQLCKAFSILRPTSLAVFFPSWETRKQFHLSNYLRRWPSLRENHQRATGRFSNNQPLGSCPALPIRCYDRDASSVTSVPVQPPTPMQPACVHSSILGPEAAPRMQKGKRSTVTAGRFRPLLGIHAATGLGPSFAPPVGPNTSAAGRRACMPWSCGCQGTVAPGGRPSPAGRA